MADDVFVSEGRLATEDGVLALETLAGGDANHWIASDHGLKAWTFDPNVIAGGNSLTGGVIKLDRFNIRSPITVSSARIWTVVAGSTLTADQNYVGIYDSTGARLVTVDADVAFAATAGIQTIDLGSALLLTPGFYWWAWLTNGGTAPQIARAATATGKTAAINVGLTASTARSATNSTGQTTLPASITPASNANNSADLWVGLA